jgi:hypothetical protein
MPAVAPGIKYSLPAAAAAGQVTSLAFSPAGDLLVAADSLGYVHAWWLEGDEELHGPVLSWQPYGSRSGWNPAVASVNFLHQAADNSSLLLTGDATNQTLKLWALPAAGSAARSQQAQPVCLQTVTFTATAQGTEAYFCHAVIQPELQLLVLANTVRKQVYTLHYTVDTAAATATGAAARLDYAAFFSVKQPILSLAPALESVESQAFPGDAQAQQLLLYCVQTEGIQQYTVSPLLCSSTTSGAAAPVDAAAAVNDDVEDGEEASSATAGPVGLTESPPAAAASAAAVGAGELEASQSPAAAQAATGPVDSAAADADADVGAVPPAAKLPTPGKLLHQGSTGAAADSNHSFANSVTAQPAAVPAAADNAGDGELRAAAEAAVASALATPVASSAAPLPPMPTSGLMHSAEKVLPSASEGVAAPMEMQPALPSGNNANGGLAVAPAATGTQVVAADVAALQQQMQQLLQMQQELSLQLQANSQQTVAGRKTR